MLTIASLREFGADVDTGLARCAGKEDLYLKLVRTIGTDPKYDKLVEAVNNRNYEEAFDIIHALKGVVMNLSITPLYDKISELTEHLRAGDDMDYTGLLDDMLKVRADLIKLFD